MNRQNPSRLEKASEFFWESVAITYFIGVMINENLIKHPWYHLCHIPHIVEGDPDMTIARYHRTD